MQAVAAKRRNASALRWLRGLAFALVTYLALAALGFYPTALVPTIALGTGILGLFTPVIAVLVFLVSLGVPLAAGNILVASVFLVLGFATIHYLSESQARVFLLIALALAATLIRAEWGAVVLMGLLLGSSEGAVAAFVACIILELAGIFLGVPAIGTLTTGGTQGLVDLGSLAATQDPLAFRWFMPNLSAVDPGDFFAVLASPSHLALLAIQPALWATAAALAGRFGGTTAVTKRPLVVMATAGGVTVGLAGASIGLSIPLGGVVPIAAMSVGLVSSLAVALAGAAVSQWVFPIEVEERAVTGAARDDADVDELLRTISTAEETLASKHTVQRAVLITDMKSFSRLTEDLGSAETAKLVQRHRDLLLPIVERAGGKGKSTGGDGLIAAFDDPTAAIGAALDMQRALAGYNASRPGQEAVLVRAGVASGEVVLDKGGKPFLGGALNLAARVMGLADGGQVFTTGADIQASPSGTFDAVSHGDFRLKNIAEPVPIVEVLWRDDQEARAPDYQPSPT